MNIHTADKQLDQYNAAHRIFGFAGIRIGLKAKAQANQQVDGGTGERWAFYEDGTIGFWAPETEGPFTVICPGSFTTIQEVDAQSLGMAFTIMAISHMAFDAYHEDDEQQCEQLAEWQERLRDYSLDSEGFESGSIRTILD